MFSSWIASWALPSRGRTIAGTCFSGSRLVIFLHISISFNQSHSDLELDSDGGLLLLLPFIVYVFYTLIRVVDRCYFLAATMKI